MKIRLFTLAFLTTTIFPATAGCGGRGWAPVWSAASPETSFTVRPTDKAVSFYSNDGRGLSADDIHLKTAKGTEFSAQRLDITERSVENRIANVGQMDAGTRMTTAAFEGANSIVKTFVDAGAPLIAQSIEARNQVALLKAQRPRLITELTGLVMNGIIDRKDGATNLGFPDLSAEVERRVAARLAEIATTQPVE